jgi:seryl-tRNA synthetase
VPAVLPPDGFRAEALATCYRHEATTEPGRLRSFRMLELVAFGRREATEAHIDEAASGAADLLRGLGLATERVEASDPFFARGRLNRLLPSGRKHELRLELVPGADEGTTAVASTNHHGAHFTGAFGISLGDPGAVTVSSCLGFGLERLALALYGRHGAAVAGWPPTVRARLGL